ncbi:hypothetical protein QEG98_29880 [Myxococcus sp. MxC21-1]|uniref:hypothetical protein n=1 Tax=Myxococcus sp. MxC21-1 TaxID=3041439 RepID=UPI00292E9655|nr:hypothetical protein [Myxococcus sp. MxC21-1]WNZ60189.1 hypothetical protein QEG98_29880 [Myxococcus sp. MxC21-1]
MHLRKQWLTHVLLASCLGTSASAAPRSNFDAFLARPGSTPLAVADAQAHARGLRVEHTETRLGVPSVLWSMQSGPGLETAARAGTRPEDAARAYLGQVADLYRLKREDVSAAPLQAVHQTGKGAVIVTFRQAVEGVEVFRSEVKVVMTQALAPVAVTGYRRRASSPSRPGNAPARTPSSAPRRTPWRRRTRTRAAPRWGRTHSSPWTPAAATRCSTSSPACAP